MRQILNRKSANEFAAKLLKSISDISPEIYSHTKTTCATRGDEIFMFFVYNNKGTDICTNANRLYLFYCNAMNGNGSDNKDSAFIATAELYVKAMSDGKKVDLGKLEHIKSNILPIILNKDYVASNIEKPISGDIRNTDLVYTFVHVDSINEKDTVNPITQEELDILFDGDVKALRDQAMQNAMEQLGLRVLTDTKIKNRREAKNTVYSLTDENKSIFSALGLLVFLDNICSVTHCPVYVFPISPDSIYAIPKSIGSRKKIREVYNKLIELKKPAKDGLLHLSDKIYLFEPHIGFAPVE